MTKLDRTKKLFIVAFAAVGTCVYTSNGQVRSEAPEITYLNRQEKQIDGANNDLDRVYQKILAVLESRINAGDNVAKDVKDSLVAAERKWIQWRDAEALWQAYAGGAVGGSALREDFHKNLLKLIDERKESLERCLKSIQQ
jgi:uncharacterized protein YecT (DUF1311 family)